MHTLDDTRYPSPPGPRAPHVYACCVPDRATTPRPRADVVVEELEGELVLLDPTTGDLHHLDASATLVWKSLDGRDLDSVLDQLSRTVRLERSRLARDVMDTIDRFLELGLLEPLVRVT